MPTVRQVQRTPRPDSLFAIRAQQLLADGDSLQALELCRQGLIYYPDNPTGYVMLAYSYLALGDQDRARNVLIDGFRRTGARPLRNLHRQLQQPSTVLPTENDLAIGVPKGFDLAEELGQITGDTVAEQLDVAGGLDLPGGLDLTGVLDTLMQSTPSIDDLVEHEEIVEDIGDDVVAVEEIEVEEVEIEDVAIEDVIAEEIALDDVEIVEAEIVEAEIVEAEIVEVAIKDAAIEDVVIVEPHVEDAAAEEITVKEIDLDDHLKGVVDGVKDNVKNTPPAKETSRETIGSLALHVGGQGFRTRSSNLRLIPGLEFAPLRQEETVGRQSIAPLMSEAMPEPMLPPRTHESEKTEDPQTVPMPLLDGFELTETGHLPSREKFPDIRSISDSIIPMSKEPLSLSDALGRLSEAGLTIPFGGLIDDEGKMVIEEPKLTPLEKLARQLENARIPAVEEVSEQHGVFEPSIVSDTFANILVAQKAYAEAMKAFQILARHKPERMEYYQDRIQEMKDHLER
jgi:hypothetical protein